MIAQLHSEIGRPLSITWIKSHQDSSPTSGPLSLDGIQNIAVDNLASQHRSKRLLPPHQHLPHLHHTRVSITVNGLRLPGHFDSTLRFHINRYHLRVHMQNKFSWSDSTWNLIDHHLFGQNFRSLPPAHQISRMKFVHNQQPLGSRLSKYADRSALSEAESHSLDKCPCCLTKTENQVHLLRCTLNPHHQLALRELQKALHSKDLHAIFYLISFGVIKWIAGDQLAPDDWDLRGYPVHLHPSIRDALADQADIEWLSGLKGFLRNRWITVASLSMHAPASSLDVGSGRLRHILKSLHIFTTALWKGRNKSLHGQANTNQRSINRQQDLEITHFYNRPEFLSVTDQHYCARPLSEILKFTPAKRRRWLRQVKLAHSRRLTNQQSQSRISQFFPRTPTVPLTTIDPDTVPDHDPPFISTASIPTPDSPTHLSISTLPEPPLFLDFPTNHPIPALPAPLPNSVPSTHPSKPELPTKMLTLI